ncbi:MAG: adenosylhomocysteinase [Clostridia bacterium]|nr:adenosylhomocysteinase [Clostridia bacterium]
MEDDEFVSDDRVESGRRKIAWAGRHMPVLAAIEREFSESRPFQGISIAVSVHVEAKTACLALALARGGADVSLTGCNPLSTQDDVAAALAAGGMKVFCRHGADPDTYRIHLIQALQCVPHIVIDDGGDLAELLHTTHSDLGLRIIGACEETTTGVHRLRILEREGRLRYPSMAVNDAECKHLFDNRFGTGQSVWTAVMAATNLVVAGKTVVVAGFGMCGKGVALRAKGLGANVIVTEIDPVKACEAHMEGYSVLPMAEAAKQGDLFITVTGCKDVITKEHYAVMKNDAVLCNAGHFDVEINIPHLAEAAVERRIMRENVEGFRMPDGRWIHLLAQGRLVNLAAGDGHPAEIMDMSFSLQALAAEYMVKNGSGLERRVYELPEEIDRRVATLLLRSKSLSIDTLTPAQGTYLQTWEI